MNMRAYLTCFLMLSMFSNSIYAAENNQDSQTRPFLGKLNLIESEKELVLTALHESNAQNLWDRFLSNQSELYFNKELSFFSEKSWWKQAQTILELGCGNGSYLYHLATSYPEKNYVGVEINQKHIQSSKEKFAHAKTEVVEGDAEVYNENLAEKYDVVLFRLTLQHLKDPKKALEHAYRYLTPAGHLIIIDACDLARRSSHTFSTQEEALAALNQKNKEDKTGNRLVTLEILQELGNIHTSLSEQFLLEFSNLDENGHNKVESKQMIFQGDDDRALYFNQTLLFLSIINKNFNIPLDLSLAYDQARIFLENENAWVQPGTHILILEKKRNFYEKTTIIPSHTNTIENITPCKAQIINKPMVPMQEFTTVQKPSMKVIGIECRTSNDPDRGPVDIPTHWGKFYNENIISQIPNRISNDIIALYCDYESDYTKPYSFVIGCEVSSIDNIPEGMVAKVIPAATFAKFSSKGDFPQSLIATWMNIWQSDLNRSYIGDYEVYGEKFSTSKEVDVLVAIKE